MKGELKVSLHVELEGVPIAFFQITLKIAQKGKEKYIIDVLIDGLLDIEIEGAFEGGRKGGLTNLCKDAQEATATFESNQNVVGGLTNLCKDAQEATATFESNQNVVNKLNFNLFLVIFNLSTMQAISKGSVS